MPKKSTTEKEKVFNVLKKTAASKILEYLSDLFLSPKSPEKNMPKEKTCKAYFKELETRLQLNGTTLSTSLHELLNFRIIQGGRKEGYEITDLGLFICPFLKIIKAISKPERQTIFFDERTDERAWTKHANYVINSLKPEGELLITTRWLDSFPKYKESFHPAFLEARKKKVNIKIIGSIDFPGKLKEFIRQSYLAEFRLIPIERLEDPPKILKPLFLNDFSHVMIADRTHWLYLNPHKKGETHSGKMTINDPAVADYLAEIFYCFWDLSTTWQTRV
jgi:hypothetical protein